MGQVFHLDDFFLPFEKRTPQRLSTPGGNVDHERAQRELFLPLSRRRTRRPGAAATAAAILGLISPMRALAERSPMGPMRMGA